MKDDLPYPFLLAWHSYNTITQLNDVMMPWSVALRNAALLVGGALAYDV